MPYVSGVASASPPTLSFRSCRVDGFPWVSAEQVCSHRLPSAVLLLGGVGGRAVVAVAAVAGRWRERNLLRRGGAGGGAVAVAVLSGRVHSGGASDSVHQR